MEFSQTYWPCIFFQSPIGRGSPHGLLDFPLTNGWVVGSRRFSWGFLRFLVFPLLHFFSFIGPLPPFFPEANGRAVNPFFGPFPAERLPNHWTLVTPRAFPPTSKENTFPPSSSTLFFTLLFFFWLELAYDLLPTFLCNFSFLDLVDAFVGLHV